MRRKGIVYPTVRQMVIGDSEFFPESEWNAARSAAAWLKKLYGSIYSVHRNKKEPHNIIVTRLE